MDDVTAVSFDISLIWIAIDPVRWQMEALPVSLLSF
jgi:hypothetical protein